MNHRMSNRSRTLSVMWLTNWLLTWLAICGLSLCEVRTLAGQDGTSVAADKDNDAPRPTVIVVVGAGGTDEYSAGFGQWADRWRQAAREGDAGYLEIGRGQESQAPDREQLQSQLAEQAGPSNAPLWLVLIGHGTFYRDVARFNLRGPDVSADELNDWLKIVRRPLVVINCASSSGPFLSKLAAPGRTIITATRSGAEQNFARFGDYLSAAMLNPEADLDHDDQVSLLEAYLLASAEVERFYTAESRLATERALLDDNGDGLGTPASFFRGARAVRAARDGAPLDGQQARRQILIRGVQQPLTAEQRSQRDALEDQVEQLRLRKSTLAEDAYYQQLESLLIPLARLYEAKHTDGTP